MLTLTEKVTGEQRVKRGSLGGRIWKGKYFVREPFEQRPFSGGIFCVPVSVGFEPQALYVLGKHSSPGLGPQHLHFEMGFPLRISGWPQT